MKPLISISSHYKIEVEENITLNTEVSFRDSPIKSENKSKYQIKDTTPPKTTTIPNSRSSSLLKIPFFATLASTIVSKPHPILQEFYANIHTGTIAGQSESNLRKQKLLGRVPPEKVELNDPTPPTSSL